ncbi:MAG: hypothetical protein JWN93_3052 [Hyphomicrobiales bacterium]|nr:hypothetical protein [Hyphomicrobiales bacterium]
MSAWRDEKNAKALARLNRSLPAIFPKPALVHAMARSLIPPTPRLAVDSYWREHPVRADRLARALARKSGAPAGWTWRSAEVPGGFRSPPAPYRETPYKLGPSSCCLCGQPVYKFGWHEDLWGGGQPNRNASWHACCAAAWKLWTAPREHLKVLRTLQGRTCPATGTRLLKSAEVDHRTPLYRVWRERRDMAWPDLLAFWGAPNLQVINRNGHQDKSIAETRERTQTRRMAREPSAPEPCEQ